MVKWLFLHISQKKLAMDPFNMDSSNGINFQVLI
jgi:hypothetical protein